MASHFYRFRSLRHILSEYQELEKQEIYFAILAELNDPMEGFTDIFWQGDEIVWENLFRHYVVCLERACGLLALVGENGHFNWDYIPIIHFNDPSLTPQHKALHNEILQILFSDGNVRSFIAELTAREKPIRRSELRAHLQIFHLLALSAIYQCYTLNGLMADQPFIANLQEKSRDALSLARKSIALMKQIETEHPHLEHATDTFFTFRRLLDKQLKLINHYNGVFDSTKENKVFVFVNFCDEYVDKIETLVYPPWYVACFMENCHDSSVWGSYGDKHTGVCLKFKADLKEDKSFIKLRRMNGFTGDNPIYEDVEHSFFKVDYTKGHVQVDFFKSISRLPIPTLKKYWYYDQNGKQSPCGDDIFKSPDVWRKRYWEDFFLAASCKLQAWSYEQEYRLILPWNEFNDFSSKDGRKVTYDFSYLEGIIFGIMTPMKEKMEICKIIEEKCRKHSRTDFKFYQAYYSPEKGIIEHHEMGLLKFK